MAEGAQETAEAAVGTMLANDAFSRWLGVELAHLERDHCTLRMTVRSEMCNGFGICHGGVTFALADSAFAFASNSRGRLSVSTENSIVYAEKVEVGDVLTAEAIPRTLGHKLGTWDVTVVNQQGSTVALFRGTVYRTSRPVVASDDGSVVSEPVGD